MTRKNQRYSGNTDRITQHSAADRVLIAGTLLFCLASIVDNQMVFNFSLLFGIVYLMKMDE